MNFTMWFFVLAAVALGSFLITNYFITKERPEQQRIGHVFFGLAMAIIPPLSDWQAFLGNEAMQKAYGFALISGVLLATAKAQISKKKENTP